MSATTTVPTQPGTASGAAIDNTVSVEVGGMSLAGWTRVSIVRGVERCPSSFSLEVTERYPTQPGSIAVQPGAPCVLKVGSDAVITGYVDRYEVEVSSRGHTVRLLGRSKCQDIVDCSALVSNCQVGLGPILTLATALCAPFGIDVSTITSGSRVVPTIPAFNVTLGETPYEIIETAARYAALLVYDDTDGNLVLSEVGQFAHASGFAEGVNAQGWDVSFSMDGRFSRYIAVLTALQNLSEFNNAGNLLGETDDLGVPRYRPMVIVSEQYVQGQSLAVQRAAWEAQRRVGRSQVLTVRCDAWRDSAGTLWTPNNLAAISFPSVKLEIGTSWTVVEVEFSIDLESGTSATVMLMPPKALTVEPPDQFAYDWQVQQALTDTGNAPPQAPPATTYVS